MIACGRQLSSFEARESGRMTLRVKGNEHTPHENEQDYLNVLKLNQIHIPNHPIHP